MTMDVNLYSMIHCYGTWTVCERACAAVQQGRPRALSIRFARADFRLEGRLDIASEKQQSHDERPTMAHGVSEGICAHGVSLHPPRPTHRLVSLSRTLAPADTHNLWLVIGAGLSTPFTNTSTTTTW